MSHAIALPRIRTRARRRRRGPKEEWALRQAVFHAGASVVLVALLVAGVAMHDRFLVVVCGAGGGLAVHECSWWLRLARYYRDRGE